jgi:class 3 adenylate cyclase
MSAETVTDPKFEIGHVLFVDIVGYSKLSGEEQKRVVRQLNETVRATLEFQRAEAAGQLLRLPAGDGMALVFSASPEAAVQCALEISRALKEQPHMQVRMGVNSGPIDQVEDVNDRSNVSGAGINMAQRVMSCGDAGHILLARRVSDDLAQYEKWRPYLHELGEVEVKHGVRINIVNLCFDGIGNSKLPARIREARRRQKSSAGTAGAGRSVAFDSFASGVGCVLPSAKAQKCTRGHSTKKRRRASVQKSQHRSGQCLFRRWRAGRNTYRSLTDRRPEGNQPDICHAVWRWHSS